MNTSRIVLGGLLAGLIMNVSEAALHAGILGAETESLYQRLNAPPPMSIAIPLTLVAVTFVIGITSVWLYAAVRPRFGAGARTALLAGFVVWVVAHLWSGVYLGVGYFGIIPGRLAWIPIVWGLFEATLATLAGAAIYKEPIN